MEFLKTYRTFAQNFKTMSTNVSQKHEQLHEEVTRKIIRACYKVHDELGCGFLEKVYQEAVAVVLKEMGVPFEREKHLQVVFHGQILQCDYIADFVVADAVIIEIKAVTEMSKLYEAQTINYLKITNMNVALLVNFGTTSLQVKRIIKT